LYEGGYEGDMDEKKMKKNEIVREKCKVYRSGAEA
jgi:hypothetical protein